MALNEATTTLTPTGREEAISRLRGLGMRTDLFLGLFLDSAQVGFSLDSDIIRAVCSLGVPIEWDLYFIQ